MNEQITSGASSARLRRTTVTWRRMPASTRRSTASAGGLNVRPINAAALSTVKIGAPGTLRRSRSVPELARTSQNRASPGARTSSGKAPGIDPPCHRRPSLPANEQFGLGQRAGITQLAGRGGATLGFGRIPRCVDLPPKRGQRRVQPQRGRQPPTISRTRIDLKARQHG